MTDPLLDRYIDIAHAHDGVRVKGKANRYTSMNGNMFSFVNADLGLCLRLAKDDRTALMAAFGTGDVMQYGAVMREYAALPPGALMSDAAPDWFARSVAYARILKAKPTKRKAPKP